MLEDSDVRDSVEINKKYYMVYNSSADAKAAIQDYLCKSEKMSEEVHVFTFLAYVAKVEDLDGDGLGVDTDANDSQGKPGSAFPPAPNCKWQANGAHKCSGPPPPDRDGDGCPDATDPAPDQGRRGMPQGMVWKGCKWVERGPEPVLAPPTPPGLSTSDQALLDNFPDDVRQEGNRVVIKNPSKLIPCPSDPSKLVVKPEYIKAQLEDPRGSSIGGLGKYGVNVTDLQNAVVTAAKDNLKAYAEPTINGECKLILGKVTFK